MANFDYYTFRIKTSTEKVNNEISFYEKAGFKDISPVREYHSYLKERIGLDKQDQSVHNRTDDHGNRCEIKKINLDEYTKDLDIFVYKKPWTKLKEFHKIMKIKEFIDNLKYNKKLDQTIIAKNKEYLKKEICTGLKNKKFIKNKSEIIYDIEEMKITSISCLDFCSKKKLYEVEW